MKISLLVPTRKRPDAFYEMCLSVLKTVGDTSKIEVVAYLDHDDNSSYMFINNIKIIRGSKPMPLSAMWNECQKAATGDIFMHASDNIRFVTPGWDIKVREQFEEFGDKIILAHGDDGYWGQKFGSHGFVHKKWIETVGYFVPPYFSSQYDRVWLNDIANELGRRIYIPNVATEYINYRIGTEKFSQINHDESLLYTQKQREREEAIAKLRACMADSTSKNRPSKLKTQVKPDFSMLYRPA